MIQIRNKLINLILFKYIFYSLKIKMSKTKIGKNYDYLFRYILVGDLGT